MGGNVKTQYSLPLAVAIGLGFGAVAIRGLHARTTAPPIYLVVEIDEITDASGFEALRQTADATAVEVQFEDGRYFARTEKVTALDGSAPKFFALIAFDNMTKAKAFNDSVKNNTALRTRATKSMMLKASESGIIAPAELADLRREMGEDQYQQEFECSFEAAIKGAFY